MARASVETAGYLRRGTSAFRLANLALFTSSLLIYAAMYSTQPLLPIFTRDFAVSPAVASLAVSVTTVTLAVCMLLMGSLSEAWGRKRLMVVSLFASTALALLAALAPTFPTLLGIRALQGVALAGVPAVAMAYLSEEVAPASLGFTIGLLIAGNSIGGMAGRTSVGVIAAATSWRVPLAIIGGVGIVCAFLFARLLPPSRHFEPRPLRLGALTRSLVEHLRDPGLLCLYGIAFLIVASFIPLYNYIQFQLESPPYALSQATVSSIFFLYLFGTAASTVAGQLADRFGRRRVLPVGILVALVGGLVTLAPGLWFKVAGTAVLTAGFFAAHSVASSWVGRRAPRNRAQASALYLFFYYMGSSVGGTVGGLFWGAFGWGGVIGMVAGFLLVAAAISGILTRIPPALPATAEAHIDGNAGLSHSSS